VEVASYSQLAIYFVKSNLHLYCLRISVAVNLYIYIYSVWTRNQHGVQKAHYLIVTFFLSISIFQNTTNGDEGVIT